MGVSDIHHLWAEIKLTLLFKDSEKTISECTFRLFILPWSMSLMARKHAPNTWSRDKSTSASRNAYSKSLFPSKSCWRRKGALLTSVNRATRSGYSGKCESTIVSIFTVRDHLSKEDCLWAKQREEDVVHRPEEPGEVVPAKPLFPAGLAVAQMGRYAGQAKDFSALGRCHNLYTNTANAMETPVSDHNGLKRASDGQPPSAKKAKTSSSRTGQACDRCKIRKIRCDARPGGCSPCLQNNSECKTTDRITGRAISRGHTENLENENTNLKMYIIELQAQLRQNGQEPGPPPAAQPGYAPLTSPYGTGWDNAPHGAYGQASPSERHNSTGSLLPEFRAGCIGDNYLGVASENNWLSPIEGTSLALFGAKIDLAEFTAPESNSDTSAMSYQTFLAHAFGHSPAKRPDLPPYDNCKVFVEWYFRSVQGFTPILHKPDFMDMLYRIYHEGYQPSAAERVMVHMVLAIINFQFSSRNDPNESAQARSSSLEHYHYSLTFIPQLFTSHKLEDIQALALICAQLRNQPRPGAAWMFTNTVLGLAIESGLHRSAKSWASTTTEQMAHTIEMRKRVFWSLLLFHVAISGKLGRPMPLRLEDFDIEIPEPIDDNLPSETNLTKWKKCSWRSAIQGFKLLKILMQVFSTIYAIRSSTVSYEVNVRQLEKDLQAFEQQIPPELSCGPQTRQEDRVSALFIRLSVAECELLLHHPSLCRSHSPQAISNNLEVSLAASNKMLTVATQLKQLKSLDTTWYYATDFLAAIFTTLFAYTEKRDHITSADLQRLTQDMDAWLDVMGDVGQLLGMHLIALRILPAIY
jgi:hypothetical protein